MTNGEIRVALRKLAHDSLYYGEYGKQFQSNSNIQYILSGGEDTETQEDKHKNPHIIKGGLYHAMINDPTGVDFWAEKCSAEEIEEVEVWVFNTIKNKEVDQLIYKDDVEFEVPIVGELYGIKWKGKIDCVNHTRGLLLDFKTTAFIGGFSKSCERYNYTSQQWIYSTLYNKLHDTTYRPTFLPYCKSTAAIELHHCSQAFLLRGMDLVQSACEILHENTLKVKTLN